MMCSPPVPRTVPSPRKVTSNASLKGSILLRTNGNMKLGEICGSTWRKFDGRAWSNPQHTGGHAAGHFIKWHTIANQAASVLQDVRRIREHPLVPVGIPIYGYV